MLIRCHLVIIASIAVLVLFQLTLHVTRWMRESALVAYLEYTGVMGFCVMVLSSLVIILCSWPWMIWGVFGWCVAVLVLKVVEKRVQQQRRKAVPLPLGKEGRM